MFLLDDPKKMAALPLNFHKGALPGHCSVASIEREYKPFTCMPEEGEGHIRTNEKLG
jgi:hypothetical protein